MFYLDASAAAKLVLREPGSAALGRWMASADSEVVSSDLLRTELLRAIRRHAPEHTAQGRAVLDSISIIGLSRTIYERAATIGPSVLRSLDAIHLATAMEFGDELEGIITYDDRMGVGARGLGIDVIAPS